MSAKDVLTSCLEAVQKTMLSVGSGDGSQQEALVKSGLKNLHVTFYDSQSLLLRKYPHAKTTLEFLRDECTHPLRFQVDATKVDREYKRNSFDLIFFTFPHTGVPNSSPNNVRSNQALLRQFLQSASKLLKPGGEIQITLKNGEHYERWKLPSLLQGDMNLHLISRQDFDPKLFPGYKHRLTTGTSGKLKTVPYKQGAKVYIFSPRETGTQGSEKETLPFASKLLTILSSPHVGWTDEELWSEVYVVLESLDSTLPCNVLQLRRRIVDPQPETRQLNRILYAMERSGLLQRHAPSRWIKI